MYEYLRLPDVRPTDRRTGRLMGSSERDVDALLLYEYHDQKTRMRYYSDIDCHVSCLYCLCLVTW